MSVFTTIDTADSLLTVAVVTNHASGLIFLVWMLKEGAGKMLWVVCYLVIYYFESNLNLPNLAIHLQCYVQHRMLNDCAV